MEVNVNNQYLDYINAIFYTINHKIKSDPIYNLIRKLMSFIMHRNAAASNIQICKNCYLYY